MSVVHKDPSKIDRLSQLPPELLDDIFDLAAFSHKLCTVPPSQSLRPFHEKALYRNLRFESFPQFERFIKTFDNHRTKVTSLSKGSLTINFRHKRATFPVLGRIISALSPSRLEFGARNGIPAAVLLLLASKKVHYSNLRVCSLFGNHPNMVVTTMRNFSSLRMVKLSETSFNVDASISVAPQVTQIAYMSYRTQRGPPFTSPISILSFFPSATIVSLDLICFHESEYESIPSILAQLTPSLRILRLQSVFEPGLSPTKPLDIPRFSSLQELHLDRTFLPDHFETTFLGLHDLVDLSLGIETLWPDFFKLLQGPTRLRHLRNLRIEFGPIEVGEDVDLDYALTESEDDTCDEEGNGLQLLEGTESFTQMSGWALPLIDFVSDDEVVEALDLAEKVERIARGADVHVSTNLNLLRQAIHRQVVEYYNRGIGCLYLHWPSTLYDSALDLAKSLDIKLPVLEIDLKERVETKNLEWFKIRMKDVEVDGNGECYALNLRVKKK